MRNELDQRSASAVERRNLPAHVQSDERIAHLVHDPRQHVLTDLAGLDELHGRHTQAFLVRIHGLDREAARVHPSRVELMPRRTDPGHELAVVEYRAHGGEVGMVDRTEVRDRCK
jgi:hypothetical protein